MNQALIIAAVFEFSGALLLGHTNVNTIAGGIADRTKFNTKNDPYLFCYGLMCALWVGGAFQLIASRNQINVSATHSIIGGIIGFALTHSREGVLWVVDKPESVPPYAGVVPIVIAWFFSPIFGAIASFTIFVTIRTLVLRSDQPVKRSYFVLPIMIFLTIWINVYFVFTKGAKAQLSSEKWDQDKNAWVAACVAAGCSLISLLFIPYIMSRVEERIDRLKREEEDKSKLRQDLEYAGHTSHNETFEAEEFDMSYITDEGILSKEDKERIDRENMMDEFDPTKAEKFDRESEFVFSFMQVCTAIAVIFAHGANEVGYASGPLSTIYDVIMSTTSRKKYPKLSKLTVPSYWIICICAVGLVLGLALYGTKPTLAYGFKLAKLSASRGFSAELATAIVITVAAQYGLPTSSSQTITGAIVGVGLAEGVDVGVNWKYFFLNFLAWVVTLAIMGLCTSLLYSQGAYAPLENNP